MTNGFIHTIEFLRVLISIFFFLVSSWYDYKFREVPNGVWVLFAPIGFALTFTQYYAEYVFEGTYHIFLYWLLSVGITTAISFLLFYAGFFGGADAKALICLSITLPYHPAFSPICLGAKIIIFPLAVLVNAIFFSSLLVLFITGYNLIRYIHDRGDMFRGFKHEPSWRKIIVFMTGIKVRPEKIKNAHYLPLEYHVERSGGIARHLKVSPKIEGDIQIIEGSGEVWATPGLPFLIFITAGFIAALFLGDFADWLLESLFSLLI